MRRPSWCKDGRLRVWDTETWDELGELPVPRKPSPLNLADAGWAILSERVAASCGPCEVSPSGENLASHWGVES